MQLAEDIDPELKKDVFGHIHSLKGANSKSKLMIKKESHKTLSSKLEHEMTIIREHKIESLSSLG